MAKIPPIYITVHSLQIDGGVISLDELAQEVAKRLYQMSRSGSFKLHERAIVSDMAGIKTNG